jgi:general secretion pathway protein F
MPLFRYRAYGEAGDLAEGRIDAMSAEAAEATLGAQGLTPFRLDALSDGKVPWWKRELFSSSGPGRVDLALFTREFSELYVSGIPLDDCLRILSDEATTAGMRRISAPLLAGVLDGSTLADAMQQQSRFFSPEYLNVVRAGEISGTLAQSFQELADLMERRAAIDARVRSALTYPVVLIGLAAVSVGVVVGVLVPSIAPIFAESGKPVPEALQLLVSLRDNWLLFFLSFFALAAAGFGLVAFIQKAPSRQLVYDGYKLRLPAIGAFLLQKETARFARTLGTLLKAGVPLLQASVSAQAVVHNRVIAAKIGQAVGMVREGSSLHNALRSDETFPPVVLRMISVGEETAKLDRMLLRAAVMFEDRTQRSVDNLMSLLTPALTLLIAGLVGGLVLTVMSAILSINELAAG